MRTLKQKNLYFFALKMTNNTLILQIVVDFVSKVPIFNFGNFSQVLALFNFEGSLYECKVNVNEEDSSKLGIAIVWKSSLPVKNVTTFVACRAQVAYLGKYAMLNLYAPLHQVVLIRNMKGVLSSPRIFSEFSVFI